MKVGPNAESLIGITVGDYKLIDIIGQGGMGTVYTAEHQQLHHKTACKVLRAKVANHPETIERFLQEARSIGRIHHINLTDIFDIGELPDKRLYYVMEKLNGRTLRVGKSPCFGTTVWELIAWIVPGSATAADILPQTVAKLYVK